MRDNTLPHPGKPVWTEPQNLSVCGQGQRCAPGEDSVKLLDLKREGGAQRATGGGRRGGGRGGRPTRWPLLQEQPQQQQVGGWRRRWRWRLRPWSGGLGQSQSRWWQRRRRRLPRRWRRPQGLGAERSCCSDQRGEQVAVGSVGSGAASAENNRQRLRGWGCPHPPCARDRPQGLSVAGVL